MEMKTYLETPEGKYMVSTCQLSKSPLPNFTKLVTMIGDQATGNEEDTRNDFETMLFLDGRTAPYPFGNLPGNKLQGVYQRYATKEEAEKGHNTFVARVRAILTEKERRFAKHYAMEELQEVKQMVTKQMEADGFIRPTILLVGTKSRLGTTFTSFPGGFDAAVAKTMRSQGKQTAIEHPEVGKLVRAYFATSALLTPTTGEQEPQEVVIIHGIGTGTGKHETTIFEVLRDHTKPSIFAPFKALQESSYQEPASAHPILQNFVDGYMSLDG